MSGNLSGPGRIWKMDLIGRWPARSEFTSYSVSLRLVNSKSVGVVFPLKKPKGWPSPRGVEAVLDAKKISIAISGPLDPSHSSKRYRLPVILGTTRLDFCHEDKDYLMQCFKNLENAGAKIVNIPPFVPLRKLQSGDRPSPSSSSSSRDRSLIRATVVNSTPQAVKSVASQPSSLKRSTSTAQASLTIKKRDMSQPQQPINGMSSTFTPRHPLANSSRKCPIIAARPMSSTLRLQNTNGRKCQAMIYEDENKMRFIIVQEMTLCDEIWHRATPVGQLREVGFSANDILDRACDQMFNAQLDSSRATIANPSKKYIPMIYEDMNNDRFVIIKELQLHRDMWNLSSKPYGQVQLVAMSSDEILNRACAEMSGVQNKP